MGMIEQQLKEIRNMTSVLHDEKRYAAEEIMRQAADTIESLSAKLEVANEEPASFKPVDGKFYFGQQLYIKDNTRRHEHE